MPLRCLVAEDEISVILNAIRKVRLRRSKESAVVGRGEWVDANNAAIRECPQQTRGVIGPEKIGKL